MNRRRAIMFASAAIVSGSKAQTPLQTQAPSSEGGELDAVRALLKVHDDAITNHDLRGVLACLTEKPAIMAASCGKIWSGPEEVRNAYQRFFEGYDKGQQNFQYQFKFGGLAPDLGWLMASGNVKGKKDGKEFSYPLNVSLTLRKADGKWRIAVMHLSPLAGDQGREFKESGS